MRSLPPDISFTRVTYSCAISLKMSFAPHAPCILSTTGDWATEIIGKPVIAAPVVAAAAPVRNLRREAAVSGSARAGDCAFFFRNLLSISSSVLVVYRGTHDTGLHAAKHPRPCGTAERQVLSGGTLYYRAAIVYPAFA